MAGSLSDEWMYNEVLDEVDDLAVMLKCSAIQQTRLSFREVPLLVI